MKNFISKSLFFLFSCILPNTLIGIYRYLQNDSSLLISQNLDRENMIFNYKIRKGIDTVYTNERKFDLRNQVEKLDTTLVNIYDKYGFSNYVYNRNPEILLIGDSYFHDPGNGTLNGFQKRLNNYFGYNCCYNLGAVMCSDFRVYNELYSIGYFYKKPKKIILEIVERNFYKWKNIYNDLVNNTFKTIEYKYIGFDLIMANNFSGFSVKNINTVQNKANGNESILFFNNKVSVYDVETIESCTEELKKVKGYLLKQNIKLFVIVVPDKETMCPKNFGKSNYEQIINSLNKNNIESLNVLKCFNSNLHDYYYIYDTHWNQTAIDRIVLELCNWISKN